LIRVLGHTDASGPGDVRADARVSFSGQLIARAHSFSRFTTPRGEDEFDWSFPTTIYVDIVNGVSLEASGSILGAFGGGEFQALADPFY